MIRFNYSSLLDLINFSSFNPTNHTDQILCKFSLSIMQIIWIIANLHKMKEKKSEINRIEKYCRKIFDRLFHFLFLNIQHIIAERFLYCFVLFCFVFFLKTFYLVIIELISNWVNYIIPFFLSLLKYWICKLKAFCINNYFKNWNWRSQW